MSIGSSQNKGRDRAGANGKHSPAYVLRVFQRAPKRPALNRSITTQPITAQPITEPPITTRPISVRPLPCDLS